MGPDPDAETSLMAPTELTRALEYANPYLTVEKVRYRFADRTESSLYLRREHDVVVCGALTRSGALVLVREYRPGPARFLLELPGGMRDPDEDPETAMATELLEETGYRGTLRLLATTWIAAYSGARKYIFLATGCEAVAAPKAAPGETFQPVLMSPRNFADAALSGQSTDLDAALLIMRELRI